MGYLLFKTLLSALLIVGASEAGKRNPLIGATLASIPLVSVLAMVWMYLESGDVVKVTQFSRDVLWLVLPSLLLFVVLIVLLERGIGFFAALGLAIMATVAGYWWMLYWLKNGM